MTVAIGREAVLICSVTNLGHYKVGWMKADDQTILSLHTRVITHNPRVSVSHDDTLKTWQLRIRQLKESDRGCYMCQINTAQMKKQHGCIDVQVPPDISDEGTSGDVTISEGENVTLSCTAKGHPEPRILWRREDGNPIIYYDPKGNVQKVDTFSGSLLNLILVNRLQMGPYLCIASNDVPPAVSKRVSLFVNFLPKVQVQKSLVGSPQTFNIKLKCEVESFPRSNNYWMLKERDEMLLEGGKYSMTEKRSGYRSVMVLTVKNLTQDDFSSYTCVASNVKGKTEATIRLYEIKLTTTTTEPPTTTTTEATTILTTPSTTTISNLILGNGNLEAIEHHPDWIYPSVPPEPLELETLPGGCGTKIIPHYCPSVAVLLLVLQLALR